MASAYLAALEKAGIEPNFWAAGEYFRRAELQTRFLGANIVTVMDGEVAVLPPLCLKTGKVVSIPEMTVWSDYAGISVPGRTPELLDYEYIYDPANFRDLSGGHWAIFRKNVRKWPKDKKTVYRPITPADSSQIEEVIVDWLSNSEIVEVHDDTVMLDYLLHGDNRWGLFEQDRLVGVNVWDYSWKYINFRYCVCRHEPFLSEYMRFLFYTAHPGGTLHGKPGLVNDGGVLDRPALKAFKDRLHPVRVREVYSWK